jgi:hypothetical protein
MIFLIVSLKNILLDFESVAKVASILWKAHKITVQEVKIKLLIIKIDFLYFLQILGLKSITNIKKNTICSKLIQKKLSIVSLRQM